MSTGERRVERIELRSGYDVARLINGGWQLAAGHDLRAIGRDPVLDQLERLVDAGFTTFDCADIYTGVEELLGRLLGRLRRRGLARESLQVHTKYVPDLAALPALTPADVEATIDRSLRRLGVDVLDLVQLHWWDYRIGGYVETALALDRLRRRGKIRHLGVTNFDRRHLLEMLDAGADIVSHQCQYSLLDRRPVADLAHACRERDVHLLAYGTVAGGFLSERWLGEPVPDDVGNRSLVKYQLIVDEAGGWPALQSLLAVLGDVAVRHGVSATAVAIRWVLDRPGVAAVIVGARSDRHLASNLSVFGLRLSAEDRQRLDAEVARLTGPEGPVYGLERQPGGRHALIMKTDLGGSPVVTEHRA